MAIFNIKTNSGGLIQLNLVNTRFYGEQLVLYVDQSTNLNNGDDDCTIVLNNDEVKAIIGMMNDYLIHTEGKTYVVLAEPLINDAVKIIVDETKIKGSE